MTGLDAFGLLLGHLVGDCVLQNDWLAANKTNQHPGPQPPRSAPGPLPRVSWTVAADPADVEGFRKALDERNRQVAAHVEAAEAGVAAACARAAWRQCWRAWYTGHLACTLHCLLYTLAVLAFSWSWMPWWGLLVCFVAHWPVDRFRLAGWWMQKVAGQGAFGSPGHPLFPWSVVVVDNVFHLLTLYLVALFAGGCTP